MNCENCIHREVCPGYQVTMPDCKQYKDESLFIELPCKVGDTGFYIDMLTKRIEKGTVKEVYTHKTPYWIVFTNGHYSYDLYPDINSAKEAQQALKEAKKDV